MEKLKIKIEESVDQVSLLENISFYILLATAFLIPIFFIPSVAFQFQFSKAVFISLAVLVSFALWLVARLKDGRYLLPNNMVFVASGVLLLVMLISTLLSSSVRTSFIGQGFEIVKWNDLGIFFGLVALLSFITLELMPLSRAFKILLWVIFVLSVVSLAIVNFPTLWYTLAFFSLLYYVFAYAFKQDRKSVV